MDYQYQSLAFGLSVAPQVFTTLIPYATEPLRKKGILVVFYVDDIHILVKKKKGMISVCLQVKERLKTLRFLINTQISSFIPFRTQMFLNFVSNTKSMRIQVPSKKIQKLKSRIS